MTENQTTIPDPATLAAPAVTAPAPGPEGADQMISIPMSILQAWYVDAGELLQECDDWLKLKRANLPVVAGLRFDVTERRRENGRLLWLDLAWLTDGSELSGAPERVAGLGKKAAPAPLAMCPCTMIEQDESCPVGYPSLLCSICGGMGHTTAEKVGHLAAEAIKLANDLGEPEDPFAAWEALTALKAERNAPAAPSLPALRRAIDEELTKHVEHYRARAALGGPGCGTDERMSSAADCARREVLKIIDQVAGPASEPEPASWRDPNEAPYDTPVRVRVGGMTFGAMLLCDVSMNGDGHYCDQWQATVDGEHPPCWTDGACWESNDAARASRQPEAWQAIEQAAPAPAAHSWKDVCRVKNGPEICEEPCLRCASPVAAEGAES